MAGLTTGEGNVGTAAGNKGSLEQYGGRDNLYGKFKYSAVEIQNIYRRIRRRRLA
jgi:hypothetical protein|tara:strand:+ start:39 stop:203 length:165 start_codon:yes stop_codon:yes gene_type:complete